MILGPATRRNILTIQWLGLPQKINSSSRRPMAYQVVAEGGFEPPTKGL